MNKTMLRATFVAALAATALPAVARRPGARARGRGDARERLEVGPLHAATASATRSARRTSPGEAWPKIRIDSFARTINYETGSMRDEIVFTRAEALGGGGYPHTGAAAQRAVRQRRLRVEPGRGGPAPGPRFVADRVHQLWITPYGVIKAALRNNATVRHAGHDGKVVYDAARSPSRAASARSR